MSLRFLTAGESHGEALVGIIEGLPAGLSVPVPAIDQELRLRQSGFGRSGRMKIEKDKVHILSGIRDGKTIGSPITFFIQNQDAQQNPLPRLQAPRPGHADLAGTFKFNHSDIRNTLERASARETAMRTAVGAICQRFLLCFDIRFCSFVTQIGHVAATDIADPWTMQEKILNSPVLCPCPKTETRMIDFIKKSQKEGETVGGIFEVRVRGLPMGLGSYTQWDLKLDGRLAQAVMSIPAIKGVEIGAGFSSASQPGSAFQDEIFYDPKHTNRFGFYRLTQRHGGIEGGMSSGEELRLRAAMKPLSTLPRRPLRTVDIYAKTPAKALTQRTDTCAVPAAAVIAKNVAAIEIARAFLEKFGGDSMKEIKHNVKNYLSSPPEPL